MKIYINVNEIHVAGKGWVKPESVENWNDVDQINYQYINIRRLSDGKINVEHGSEDVSIEDSRECMYADGCRIRRSVFFG